MRKKENTTKLGVLTEKGVYFDLWVTESDHQLLKSQGLNADDQVPDAESILTKYLKRVRNLPYADDSVQSLKLEGWGLAPFVPFVSNEEGKLIRVLSTEVDTLNNCDAPSLNKCSEWDEKSTLALISFVVEKGITLANPSVKKVAVWRKVSDQLSALGYNFTGEACDNKWRHLKSRFYELVNDKRKNFRWQYFDAMKQALEKTSVKYMTLKRIAENKNAESLLSEVMEHSQVIVKQEKEDQAEIVPDKQNTKHVRGQGCARTAQKASKASQANTYENLKEEEESPDRRLFENELEEVRVSNIEGSNVEELSGYKDRKMQSKSFKSQRRKLEMSKMPVKYRGFAKLVRKEQHKTRKLLKTLIKEQQKSTSLFEKLLGTIIVVTSPENEVDQKTG